MRESVKRAVGRKVRGQETPIEWIEGATPDGTILKIKDAEEAGQSFDLLILDAETPKLGGIGLGKMVRDEINENIPYIVLIARPQDEWLARVARPEAILPYPINATELSVTVKELVS
ncbi:response regulator transcription factor [Arcanobacterium phocae]|uniref:response regulator transcription factor n=1 Tax=Arcanobacterium phocae TaxID=131112 RepID=UPI00155F5C6D|nr:response regulator transcription factor [Arcanobacterium phocae]